MNNEQLINFARLKGWTLYKDSLYKHLDFDYKLTLNQIYREFR